jgi:hypothetical protein
VFSVRYEINFDTQFRPAIPKLRAAELHEILKKKKVLPFNLCILFLPTATKLVVKIVTNLFGPNYLIN